MALHAGKMERGLSKLGRSVHSITIMIQQLAGNGLSIVLGSNMKGEKKGLVERERGREKISITTTGKKNIVNHNSRRNRKQLTLFHSAEETPRSRRTVTASKFCWKQAS